MRRITAGNDVPFRWAVTLQDKPFDLSGKDVKVYVINSRGEIPVAQLTIEGHEVSGVFEGRYQTRLGEHSLVLHVNEGRPEMKTATVANVFELVQWSADAGGSDEGDVIVAPVLIESELSIGMGGGSSYDDTELREAIEDLDGRVAAHSEDIVNLQENKADKSELTELSAEVGKKQNTITDLETIREGASKGATAIQEVKTINGQSIVGKGDITIQGGGGGVSNEWKCIADRRLLEGEKKNIFTTYADGTPLKAKEVMVQILCDKKAAQNITGYVGIKSTNNQNEALYGSFMYEAATIAEGVQVLNQIHLEASPFFMVAKMSPGVKCTVATPTISQVQGGNLKTFQIYEDIVSVKIEANVALTSAAPYLKVYAR